MLPIIFVPPEMRALVYSAHVELATVLTRRRNSMVATTNNMNISVRSACMKEEADGEILKMYQCMKLYHLPDEVFVES